MLSDEDITSVNMSSEIDADSIGNAHDFSDGDRLLLQQLSLAQWISTSDKKADADTVDEFVAETTELPEHWHLTKGVTLHSWQNECLNAFLEADGRGTCKVVTGAGKTLLALAIIEHLQNHLAPDLRVAIVVPTIVLLNQWWDEIILRSNLPTSAIGRLGGGYNDGFDDNKRILISVLPSAAKKLPDIAASIENQKLFLIVDECHRAGAPTMSSVLKTKRSYSLALSATPERENEENSSDNYNTSTLGRELGPLIYEMTFEKALELKILPPFQIRHYGLKLKDDERARYERLSRSISDTRTKIMERSKTAHSAGVAGLANWARRVMNRKDGELSGLAKKYIVETSERKRLLYRINARTKAVVELLTGQVSGVDMAQQSRAIIFHESIDEVNRLFAHLKSLNLPVVAEHSELPEPMRQESLELYRRGVARIIVSAKSLIEGFNVPETDLGIIVASTTSVRQRIQSMGRVLRKRVGEGMNEGSIICVLYGDQTVDDIIYEKLDWDQVTGEDVNVYFIWNPPNPPLTADGPPRNAVPSENDIDPESLEVKGTYPGRYDGDEYTADSNGNVLDIEDRIARNPQDIPKLIFDAKGSYGRFRVTNHNGWILAQIPDGEQWETLFLGTLNYPFDFTEDKPFTEEDTSSVKSLQPGEPYPGGKGADAVELLYRQKHGGVIGRKAAKGAIIHALNAENARNQNAGAAYEKLLSAIKELDFSSGTISKFFLLPSGDAIFYKDGQARFITHLDSKLDFPDG